MTSSFTDLISVSAFIPVRSITVRGALTENDLESKEVGMDSFHWPEMSSKEGTFQVSPRIMARSQVKIRNFSLLWLRNGTYFELYFA